MIRPMLWHYITQAGVIGYVLTALSVVSVAVILERGAFWILRGRRPRVAQLRELLERCREGTGLELHERWPETRALRVLLDHPNETGDDAAMELALGREGRRLHRNLTLLEVNAAVAPMLGILGTVVGVIQAFQGMQGRTPDAGVMVRGLSLSMLTTAIGLIVALISIVGFHFLAGHAHTRLAQVLDFLLEVRMARGDPLSECQPGSAAGAPEPGPAESADIEKTTATAEEAARS